MENKLNKILIIDDEWKERENTYSDVLSEKYIIQHIENPTNLFVEVENKQVDCYLIDVVLENWKANIDQPQELMPILEAIKNKNVPIFLVSRQYNTLINNSGLTPLLNEIIKRNISIESFFLWNDFEKEAHRRERQEIKNFTASIGSLIELKILQFNKVLSIIEEKKADIGIVCALGLELKPIIDNIEERWTEKKDNITYTRGFIKTVNGKIIKVVAVQQEDMGTEDAAIIGSLLVKDYNVKHLFMPGVCGGRDGKVKIGDIIIPSEAIAYQRGKFENHVLEFDAGSAQSNVAVNQIFENASDNILHDIFINFTQKLSQEEGKTLKIERPKIHFNQIACGAQVVDTPNILDEIAKDVGKRKLCGVDMESFSIYRLNRFLDVKSLVIKSVMDLTQDKDDEYKEYAAYVSANFLIRVLRDEIYTL